MKKKLHTLLHNLQYVGLAPAEYQSILPRIRQSNLSSLTYASLLASLLLGILFVASFFQASLRGNRILYLCVFVLMCAIHLACRLFLPKCQALVLPLFYTFLLLAFLFGLVLGVVLQPNGSATTFCVLLFALPLLVTDQPHRVALLLCTVTALFCVSTHLCKVHTLASLDTINGLSFLFLGIAVNYVMMRTKLNELLGRAYIEQQRDTDDLTHLMTKAAFRRAVDSYILPGGAPAALLVLDVDNFKRVNDTMGHAYGDAVLRIMGECIRASFRKSDYLARFGGDEFVLFLPNMGTPEQVRTRVNMLVERMEQQLSNRQSAFSVTGSIGIAFYPTDSSDYDSLFKKADEALYTSKGKGKNCYTFYLNRDLLCEDCCH